MTEDTRCSVCRADYPQTGMRTGPAFELVGPGFRVCKRCRGAGKDARRKWEAELGASGAGGAATPREKRKSKRLPTIEEVSGCCAPEQLPDPSFRESPAGAGEAERLAVALAAQTAALDAQLAWVQDALDGTPLSEFALSFPCVRAVMDMRQALAEKDAALGRVQALIETWEQRLPSILGEVRCRDEVRAALRGEVQP